MLAHRHLKKGTNESALAILSDLKSSPTPGIIAIVVEEKPETPVTEGVEVAAEDAEEEEDDG